MRTKYGLRGRRATKSDRPGGRYGESWRAGRSDTRGAWDGDAPARHPEPPSRAAGVEKPATHGDSDLREK